GGRRRGLGRVSSCSSESGGAGLELGSPVSSVGRAGADRPRNSSVGMNRESHRGIRSMYTLLVKGFFAGNLSMQDFSAASPLDRDKAYAWKDGENVAGMPDCA